MHALIVDDQEQNLYLLRALLGGFGYDVEEARHGAEALAKARQHRPDIVISDLLMPVMDGFTLLRQWKADARLKDIPFVVYTATYTAPEDETLALDLGADAFIVKPAEPEPFVARIGALLSAASAGAMLPPRPPATDERALMKEYSEVLGRKLEDKLLELEASMTERRRSQLALEQANLRLQALSKRLLEVQEQERAVIARELHDELGQMLTAITFSLEALRRGADQALAEGIDRSVNMIEQALRQVRSLSLDLRPPELDVLGLAAALRGHITRVFPAAAAPRVTIDISGALPPLPPQLAISCFRITQEALTNVVRHAQARQVRVSVALREAQLELEIEDDGVGFEVDHTRGGGGIGLSSMAERAQSAGGSWQIESRPGAGTRVRASFALGAASAAS